MNKYLNIDYFKLKKYLINELKKEVNFRGFNKIVIALSGGLDSSLALTIAVESLGNENVYAFFMPYKSSSPTSKQHAQLIAEKNNVKFEIINISDIVDNYFKNEKNVSKLRIGNFCARTRMAIIFDKAKKHDALVLGTSNKSEITLGYATMFGDNAYSINPIGNIYKTQIFELAKYFNIPEEIINKAPSADLWEGQTDEDEIKMTYSDVDRIAYMYFDKKMSIKEIVNEGIEESKINRLLELYHKNAYKRKLPFIISIRNFSKGE